MGSKNIKKQARVRVPVVINSGQNRLGAVAVVTAVARKIQNTVGCKLSCGTASFGRKTARHYRKELLPLLDDICEIFGIGNFDISLSAVNLQIAAINDLHLEIDGFSGDIGVFFAMFSAIFGIEVGEDVIFSGAVSKGNILPVASLGVKLETAEKAGIKKFYCADVNIKDSLAMIDVDELNAAGSAVREHRQRHVMQIKCLLNVFEIFDDVFDDYETLLAAFSTGAFNEHMVINPTTPVEMIAEKICSMDMTKLRNTLSTLALANKFDRVDLLWDKYLMFYINADKYPICCGRLIYEWMCGMPPKIRNQIKIPFISMETFAKLSQFAGKENSVDLGLFFDCIRGKYLKPLKAAKTGDNESEVLDGRAFFDSVASLITAEYLDNQFGIIIDSARASFILPSTIVGSYAGFIELAEAFFNHLCGFTSLKPTFKSSDGSQNAAVYSIIERAFANKGGFAEARCRALDGSSGGLRTVLDEITAQFKRDVYTD